MFGKKGEFDKQQNEQNLIVDRDEIRYTNESHH